MTGCLSAPDRYGSEWGLETKSPILIGFYYYIVIITNFYTIFIFFLNIFSAHVNKDKRKWTLEDVDNDEWQFNS